MEKLIALCGYCGDETGEEYDDQIEYCCPRCAKIMEADILASDDRLPVSL